MWDDDYIKINLINVHRSFINVAVKTTRGHSWFFMDVYASPRAHLRSRLLPAMDELGKDAPWLLLGDFNYVLKGDEWNTRSGVSESFAEWVMKNGLIDLGCVGQKFTWCHGGSVENRRSAG